MNLVVNARDAIQMRGNIKIETQNIVISHDEQKPDVTPGMYVCLSINDDGVGMDELTQDRIFEPFFTTKQQGKGTGLGLSTVFGIVSQSNGHITVNSKLESGTSFNLYFPQTIYPIEDVPLKKIISKDSPSKHLMFGDKKIMVVEDEDLIRKFTCNILKIHGYHIVEANGPEQALNIIRTSSQKIDLMLTDLIMPEMNGKELQEIISTEFPLLPVMFMSGYAEKAIIQNDILQKGFIFISKPFTSTELLLKIKEALNT